MFVGSGEVVVEEERASFVVVEGKDKGVVNYGLRRRKGFVGGGKGNGFFVCGGKRW